MIQNNPQTIVPALPLARTSAPTDEEDDRLVKIMLQRWLTRICEDPILIHDEELRSFVESDFGYQPTPNTRKKASGGFSLIRRGVPDEDEELQRARFGAKLYTPQSTSIGVSLNDGEEASIERYVPLLTESRALRR